MTATVTRAVDNDNFNDSMHMYLFGMEKSMIDCMNKGTHTVKSERANYQMIIIIITMIMKNTLQT